jgi:hypothetical protein
LSLATSTATQYFTGDKISTQTRAKIWRDKILPLIGNRQKNCKSLYFSMLQFETNLGTAADITAAERRKKLK